MHRARNNNQLVGSSAEEVQGSEEDSLLNRGQGSKSQLVDAKDRFMHGVEELGKKTDKFLNDLF